MRVSTDIYKTGERFRFTNLNTKGVVILLSVFVIIIIIWALLRCIVLSMSLRQLIYKESSPTSILDRTLGPLAAASIASR